MKKIVNGGAALSNIRLVTDSTADIPLSVRQAYNIEMVPLKVHINNESYLDAVTIQSEQFFELLSQAGQLPTTSQPSPVDFLDTYKRLIEEDPNVQIISLHLSSALSGTFQSALLAKSLVEDKVEINTIDSKSASYGLGMLVVAAAEAAKQGKSKEECLALIEQLRKGTQLYFLVDTLEYLQKGGRIGKAAALIGSLLNIKPILSIDANGEVYSVDKVRGQKKAMARIAELLKADFNEDEIELIIAHSNAEQTAQDFANYLKEHLHIEKVSFTCLGPVIGTHVGPGTVAAFAVRV